VVPSEKIPASVGFSGDSAGARGCAVTPSRHIAVAIEVAVGPDEDAILG
jgi:hypothetical protein